MKKTTIFLALLVLCLALLAACSSSDKKQTAGTKNLKEESAIKNLRHIPLTDELLNSGILIVDIRTEPEWRETGVMPGTLCLTFFDADGNYDADAFIAELSCHVDPQDEVAILCRSGRRSFKVGKYLVNHGFRSVVNVYGGIKEAIANGMHTVPYSATL